VCKKCQVLISIAMERFVVQYKHLMMGRIGLNNARLIDVGGMGFKVGCGCDNEISKSKLYLPAERISINCHSCFQSMNISYMGLKFYNSTLKGAQVQTNEELPNRGNCKHMKLSFRWFRYGCCGRCFSCDDCHLGESVNLHEMMRGITMLCGFCSKEQSVNSECIFCKKQVVKGVDKGGHWEGGMGCRDQTLLSRKDAKKYTGMTKKKP